MPTASAAHLSELAKSHGLRPIIVSELSNTGETRDFIVSVHNDLLEIRATQIYQAMAKGKLFDVLHPLYYDVTSAVYHCKKMALAYVDLCNRNATLRLIPDLAKSESDTCILNSDGEPYFEFDALLSSLRRSYDKLGHVVWTAFGTKGGGRPDNYADTLRRCSTIPPSLASRLNASWSSTGARIKTFRDCTQHFASADFGFSSVWMRRLDHESWYAVAPIPDNPEVKSKSRFTYTAKLDALTYGWESLNEIVDASVEVVSHLA